MNMSHEQNAVFTFRLGTGDWVILDLRLYLPLLPSPQFLLNVGKTAEEEV